MKNKIVEELKNISIDTIHFTLDENIFISINYEDSLNLTFKYVLY